MVDFARRLERSQPCREGGPRIARVYRSNSAQTVPPLEIMLGDARLPNYRDPLRTLRLLERLHGRGLDGVVAADVFQVCDLGHPADTFSIHTRPNSFVLERFRAIGFVGSSGIVAVRPSDISPPKEKSGIGQTTRRIGDIREGTAVQFMATTPFEDVYRPVTGIIEAAVSAPHRQVFIAVHDYDSHTIESLVPPLAEPPGL